LQDREREAWLQYFERVEVRAHELLFAPDEPLDYLWFPESGVCSQVVESSEGRSVEVGLCGSEGMLGLAVVFGARYPAARAVAQMDLTALRIGVEEFLSRSRDLGDALLGRLERYAARRLGIVAQIAACNRLHKIEQRLCRWLLMVRDLAGADRIPITHETLALMLGTRRASVTETAGHLQERALIRYDRGTLEFLDVNGLEGCACECYGVIRRLNDAL
jgi:CRP-like cAMP-binding protein